MRASPLRRGGPLRGEDRIRNTSGVRRSEG